MNSRNALRNTINKRKLTILGMENQYAPITNKLEELKEIILLTKTNDEGKTLAIEGAKEEFELSEDDKELWLKIQNINSTKKEKGTLRLSEIKGDYRIYQLGDRSVALNNHLTLRTTDGLHLKLNDGLMELFFKSKPNPQIFSEEDVNKYKEFIKDLGIDLNENTEKQRIVNAKIGGGVAVILNNDPVELRQRLQVLLAAKINGHNNVFNEANEILKILLEKKLITVDGYKHYLSLLKG